ncbi:MAG: helix-turn-helix transcriptional regulator [Bacteroidota bacterium]
MISKEKILSKLGSKIRLVRKDKNITQVELANSIGKDQQSIQRLESGKINPSYYYLLEVAEGLGVSIEELLS